MPPRLRVLPCARRAQLIGLKAKLYAKKRHSEKVTMKKTIAQHSERDNKHKAEDAPKGAVPHYLLDREQARGARALCARHSRPDSPARSRIRLYTLNSASPRRRTPAHCGT
jgi:hypothetical protein